MQQRSALSLVLARLGFIVLLLLLVPATALLLLFSPPFESWRRAKAEALLSDAIDLQTQIKGPIEISFGWEPTIAIGDLAGVGDDMPSGLKAIGAKRLGLTIALLPLLTGNIQLSGLMVDGLEVDIEIPVGDDDDDEMDISGFIGDFVRSPFAGDAYLRDAQVNYDNQDTGLVIRYAFDSLSSSPAEDSGVEVYGSGSVNGEPLRLDGKVDPPADGAPERHFVLSAHQAGLTSALAGKYLFGDPSDSLDATLSASAPALKKFLAVYGLQSDFEGRGDFAARLNGFVAALRMTDLGLKLAFESGDAVRLSGSVANVMTGEGLDLTVNGDIAPRVPQSDEAKPLFDLGVTGFSGRIGGAIDEVHVRDLHVITTAVTAQLRDIGPITAKRLYKDPEGRLGLYDLVVLAGDPARPTLRIGGNVTNVLEFKGFDLKGEVDFLTADLLDLAAEEHAGELGHIRGNVAVSDADGSLGIESLSAKISDSALLSLNIDLVFDDLEEAGEITLAAHLDIFRFKPFAAALGSNVEELGAVRFDGNVTGGAQRISATGTSLVGETTITGTATGAFAGGKPTLSGNIATPLLHLSDLLKLSSINSVYQANVDEQDVDVMDYSKVWQTLLVDFEIAVAKIAGGGGGASNIKGRVTYLAGVIGLDPLTMTFLGGSASTNGKIDTSLAENSFALKGRVNNMRIGSVLREMKVSYPVSGALHVSYDLTGFGNTMAQIPRSLSGSLSITLRNGWLGTSLLDLAGLSLPAWLLRRVPGGNQADLVCAVAPFTFDKGKATSRGLVLETNDVQVVGVGYIDFRQSEVNVRFKPQALHQQFFKIAQPFAVRGPLSRPRLSLTGSPVAGAVTEFLAFPFNLLQTIVQPATNAPGRVPCRIIHTSTAQKAGWLGLLKKSSPILNPPLLGPILRKPLLGGQTRRR